MQETFQVPLGGGALELEAKEALELRALKTHPGYSALRKVLEGINESSKAVLQDPAQNLDTLRVCQGKIAAVAEVAHIIEVDIEAWYEEGKSSEHDEETA